MSKDGIPLATAGKTCRNQLCKAKNTAPVFDCICPAWGASEHQEAVVSHTNHTLFFMLQNTFSFLVYNLGPAKSASRNFEQNKVCQSSEQNRQKHKILKRMVHHMQLSLVTARDASQLPPKTREILPNIVFTLYTLLIVSIYCIS